MAGPGRVETSPTNSGVLEHVEQPVSGAPPKPQAKQHTDKNSKNTVEPHDPKRAPFELPQRRLDMNDLPTFSAGELQGLGAGYMKEVLARTGNDTADGLVSGLSVMSPSEFKTAMSKLSESNRFGEVMEKIGNDPKLRSEFLTVAVKSGYLAATPPRAQANPGALPPPEQPSLVRNERTLAPELRRLIHAENTHQAAQYEAKVDQYTKRWCEAVMDAKTPADIRKLGAYSAAPSMSEPGVVERDRKDFGWNQGLTQSGRGAQQAANALGDKISDLRGQPRAGSYSADFEIGLKGKAGIGVFQRGFEAKVGETGAKAEPKTKVGTSFDADDVSFASTVDNKGTLTREISAGKVGVERSVDSAGKSKTTISLKAVEDERQHTSVSSYASFGADTMGGGLKTKAKIVDGLEVNAKVGMTAYGIPPEYYQDIGGAQSGFFGPMPEHDAQVAWSALKPDRRDWYTRQGFNEKNWSQR